MSRMRAMAERIAALALTAALAALVWFGAVAPVRDAFAARAERVETLALDLERTRRFAGAAADLEARLAAAQQSDGADEWLVTAADPALAAAELQNQVKRAAAQARASVPRIAAEPVQTEGAFPEIRIVATMTLPQERLRDLLVGLETMRPRLTVEALEISLGAIGAARDTRSPLSLDLEMTARLQPAPGATP